MSHNKVRSLTQYWNALFRQKQSWFNWLIIIVFIVSLIVLSLNIKTLEFGEKDCYKDALEPVITIGTFAIAIIMGVQNTKNAWIEKLPKKLTVHFKFGNEYVFTCHKAYLSGESDIRQMAQQIGSQMNDNHKLPLYPYMHLNTPTVERSTQCNSRGKRYCFRHYEVTMFLSKHEKDGYTIWWDNDPEKPGNKALTTEKSINVISEMEAEKILEAQNRV